MRTVVRTLYGYALQTQLGTTNIDYEEKDGKYELTNEDMIQRSSRFVEELIGFAQMLEKTELAKED